MEYENKSLSIKSWAEDDRPREKLLLKGKSVLSDAELIAILIGSGSRKESAVDRRQKDILITQKGLELLSTLAECELKTDAFLNKLSLDEVK